MLSVTPCSCQGFGIPASLAVMLKAKGPAEETVHFSLQEGQGRWPGRELSSGQAFTRGGVMSQGQEESSCPKRHRTGLIFMIFIETTAVRGRGCSVPYHV